jgi:zinc protease
VTLAETSALPRASHDSYAIQLGNAILGGGFYATRLYRDLREQSGLVYFVGVSLHAGRTRTQYQVQFGSDPKNVAQARTIIDADLHAMATSDATSRELQLAKTTIVRDLSLQESSLDGIAGDLESLSLRELPLDQATIFARAIVGMDASDVRAAFAKWVDPQRFAQVEEGPAR